MIIDRILDQILDTSGPKLKVDIAPIANTARKINGAHELLR